MALKGHEYKSHPSYGVAQFSRRSSSRNKPLFGSSIGHSQTIILTINRAHGVRSTDLSYDSYFAREQLIEVEMSATQFAELLTSMNYGSGVPVTIRQFDKERPEDPPYESKRAQHSQEFRKAMHEKAERFKEGEARLQELLKKPKLSKADKNEMDLLFRTLSTAFTSSMPYFEGTFQEQMDKTVTEAKGEIEAFITNAVQKTGLTALQKEGKMLGLEGGENIIKIKEEK